jgi:hypothetical protein
MQPLGISILKNLFTCSDGFRMALKKFDKERRTFQRFKCRLPCNLRAGSKVYKGIITDISPRGIFIQMSSRIAAGTELHMDLISEGDEYSDIVAVVSRRRKAHQATASVERPGVGVEIMSAPEDFFDLIMSLSQA